jgi:hypothetical protein
MIGVCPPPVKDNGEHGGVTRKRHRSYRDARPELALETTPEQGYQLRAFVCAFVLAPLLPFAPALRAAQGPWRRLTLRVLAGALPLIEGARTATVRMEVPKVAGARTSRAAVVVSEVTTGDHSKGAHRLQCPRLRAAQRVLTITVANEFALRPAAGTHGG